MSPYEFALGSILRALDTEGLLKYDDLLDHMYPGGTDKDSLLGPSG